MNKKIKVVALIVFLATFFISLAVYLRNFNIEVLNPKGTIAAQQKELIVFAAALSLIVVIPVFTLAFVFAYKYRATNTKAKYTPNVAGNRKLETIWWGIPITLIAILSVITWNTSHSLDPFKPLDSDVTPMTVEVVALQWKWLFIYPEQNIATVNFVQFPTGTPVNFKITSDAPMNAFWIPQLGGQIYAMTGMSTQLHLSADKDGEYNGVSANISGEGFSGMKFTAKASSQEDFDSWVSSVKQVPNILDANSYENLAAPSSNSPVSTYAPVQNGLYDTIMMKYMAPTEHTNNKHGGAY